MKQLIIICLSICTLLSTSAFGAQALDIALEMNSFKAEYYATSQQGIIKVSGCNQCDENIYHFDHTVKIVKNNQPISIDLFIKDYWNAEYPTIFLDPATKSIILIAY
jgi:hypothetical protein